MPGTRRQASARPGIRPSGPQRRQRPSGSREPRRASARPRQRSYGADRLRNALQHHKHGEKRNETFKHENDRQTARLLRVLEDRPRARGIGQRQPKQHEHERQEQQQCADEVDNRLRARGGIRIEEIHAHMAVGEQCPGRSQHEQRGVSVNHRLGEPDRTKSEQVTRDYQRELQPHDHQHEPRHGATHARRQAVDAIGDGGHIRKTHDADDGTKARLLLYNGTMTGHDHDHHDYHDHDHSELSETQLRVRALETVLTEKGYVDPAALDAIVEAYETRIGPRNGAAVVAKAWSDPAFKQALLADASKAVATLGHVSRVGDHLVAVENTPKTHNIVVCTLCSCYPWDILGLPPIWYKSAPYRSRAVKDPRSVLADFGVTLPKDTDIRVWDSTAETRFLVLPMRPAGTEGWSEHKLAEIVTRDSMIGTGLPKQPGASR